MESPHTVLVTIGLREDGTPVAYVPDDPQRSAAVSGPTAQSPQLTGEQLKGVFEALPSDVAAQATSIAEQRIGTLESEAQEAAADASQRDQLAQTARGAIDGLGEVRSRRGQRDG